MVGVLRDGLVHLAFLSLIFQGALSVGNEEVVVLGQEYVGPIEYDCPNDGVFPNPFACDQYIQCNGGEAGLWQCTEQMLYDLTYNGCNFAEQTHCGTRPRPTNVPSTISPPTSPFTGETTPRPTTPTGPTTPPPPIDFECPGEGVYAHEERCEYYWLCYPGTVTPDLLHCFDDYLFDRRYMGCNFPHLTDCDSRLRPGNDTNPTTRPTIPTTPFTGSTTSPGPTTPPPPIDFDCPGEGVYAHEERCEYYWLCYPGTVTPDLMHCYEDYLFDRVFMGCNFPHLTDCDHRLRPGNDTNPTTRPTIPTTQFTGPTTTTTTREPPTCDIDFTCPGTISGNFPDPCDCAGFYICDGGQEAHFCCPSNLFFNPEANVCDYPDRVTCGDRPVDGGCS